VDSASAPAPRWALVSARAHAVPLVAGLVAAALVAFGPGLGVPGSSILFAMVPAAFGLALAPGRSRGVLFAAGGLCGGAAAVLLLRAHFGIGAATSLLLSGPALALALRVRGRLVVPACVALGIGTNVVAFAARAASKLLVGTPAPTRPLASWISEAAVTYPLAGAVAGLLSGLVLLRSTRS